MITFWDVLVKIFGAADKKALQVAYALITAMYMYAVQTVLAPWDCAPVPGATDGSRYVESTGELCFTEDWLPSGVLSLFGLKLFVLLPAMLIWELGKDAAYHDSLFEKYEDGKEWYEVFLLKLRFMEGAVGLLFSTFSVMQAVMVMVLQCRSLAVLKKYQPYDDQKMDDLDTALVKITIVQLVLGLLAYAGMPELIITIAMLATFAVQAWMVWRITGDKKEAVKTAVVQVAGEFAAEDGADPSTAEEIHRLW